MPTVRMPTASEISRISAAAVGARTPPTYLADIALLLEASPPPGALR
jgi:hypothetical protein